MCRRKPLDNSGRHIQRRQPTKRIPTEFFLSREVTVTINRGTGLKESFKGTTTGETNSFLRVEARPFKDSARIDEWFAKDSKHVTCQ